jgi:hypothetical protein
MNRAGPALTGNLLYTPGELISLPAACGSLLSVAGSFATGAKGASRGAGFCRFGS